MYKVKSADGGHAIGCGYRTSKKDQQDILGDLDQDISHLLTSVIRKDRCKLPMTIVLTDQSFRIAINAKNKFEI